MRYQRLLLAAASIAAAPAVAHAQDTAARTATIEELVVTATKREETAQDVPMSISVIGAEDIERRGLQSAEEYLRTMPNVAQIDRGGFDKTIIIRGVSTSPSGENFNAGPTVATYFDETSLTGASGQYGGGIDLRPVDLERIELLRGPQGTAFGDASLGGTLRLIPARPQFDSFEGRVAADLSNTAKFGGTNTMVQGVLNVPLLEELAFRAVAYQFDDSGYYRNILADDPAAIARGESYGIGQAVRDYRQADVGRLRVSGARLALRWRPIEQLDVLASYATQETQQDGSPLDNAGGYNQIFYPLPNAARVRGQAGDAIDNDVNLTSLAADYDLGWATVTSVVSLVNSDMVYANDLTMAFAGPFGLHNKINFDSTAAETRIASKLSGRLQFLAGLFYQKFNDTAYQRIFNPGPPAVNRYATNPISIYNAKRVVDQKAVFGEVSYELLSGLTATVGGRYFKYDRNEVQLREGAAYGVPFGSPTVTRLQIEDGRSVMKASLSYKPTEDRHLYATFSQGYRLGRAVAGLTPFASVCDVNNDGIIDGTSVTLKSTTEITSDSLDNYEAGGKFALFGRRMIVDGSVFHIRWKDIPVAAGLTCGGLPRGYVASVGEATSRGVEFQASWLVTDALRLDIGAGYTKAEISKDSPSLSVRKGTRLPGAPEFTANAALQYEYTLRGYDGFARVDAAYVGEFVSGLSQSAIPAAGGYAKVDVRIGLTIRDVQVELYAKNLLNEDAATFGGLGNPNTSYMMRPRTVGVQIAYKLD